MNITGSLLALIAAASVVTATPGLDTALVLRSATASGARAAAFAALGIGLGCLVWGGAVSVGLGALLAASEMAYTLLKWAGAAYLLWLGLSLILRPRDRFEASGAGVAGGDRWVALRRGFLTNLLNPMVGIFYVTFLPQFAPTEVNIALFCFLLAAIHVVLGLAWFAALILATVPLGRLLRRARVIRAMDRVTGGYLGAAPSGGVGARGAPRLEPDHRRRAGRRQPGERDHRTLGRFEH